MYQVSLQDPGRMGNKNCLSTDVGLLSLTRPSPVVSWDYYHSLRNAMFRAFYAEKFTYHNMTMIWIIIFLLSPGRRGLKRSRNLAVSTHWIWTQHHLAWSNQVFSYFYFIPEGKKRFLPKQWKIGSWESWVLLLTLKLIHSWASLSLDHGFSLLKIKVWVKTLSGSKIAIY